MNDVAVIKIGGVLLEDAAAAVSRIREIQAKHVVIVHGGGVQITRMLERMNVQSQFIDGLRVTDEVTLKAVAAALMGEVHTSLVYALQEAGLPALGVFGAVRAEQKAGPWGLVGTSVRADRRMLMHVLESGELPVIPTLALGASSLLNVNGDETATAIALALGAGKLVFLTDVEGVRDSDGVTIRRVPREVSLVDAPFVSGGMKPKLRAVDAALAGGIDTVWVGQTVFGDANEYPAG
jgi:acetylglutamate kinase